MLLGVRQVGLLGPFLWQECHKRRKAQAESKKRKKHMAEKRSPRSTPLNTLTLLSHKVLGHKGFDMCFHNSLQEMGVTVEIETSAGA